MTTKAEQLEKLNKEWAETCPCGLGDTGAQAVPGEGSADADIMFVGEAPGKKEDLEGRPFIGAAGKFLNNMLESIKMSRSDVYITNIVKFRPPNNRDPLPNEIESSWPWLQAQIEIIQPKLIVFLGRHALNRFFPGEQISKVHGNLIKKKFKKISVENFFALYHPAAALYNGGMRETLMNDFKKLPMVIKKIS
jgi:DNA polymerase